MTALSADQIEWARGKCRPPLLNIPGRLRLQAAALLEALLDDALRGERGEGEIPPILYVWRLVFAGRPSREELRRRLGLASRGLLAELLEHAAVDADWGTAHARSATKRARRLMAYGEVRKALEALAPRTPRPSPSLAEVRQKYPPAPAPLAVPVLPKEMFYFDEATVVEAVKAGGHSSAPGPDGLRTSHLRSLLPLSASLRQALLELLVAVANGHDLPGLPDVTLAPVPKPGGGWRPIGVASVLRRAIARIAVRPLQLKVAPECLEMGQLGPSEAGPQRFYLRAQRAVDEGLHVVRLDVRNAFGELDRNAAFETLLGVSRAVPDLSAAAGVVVRLCAQREKVFGAAGSLNNERGVTQGCPAGSLVFDVSLARLMQRWAEEEISRADGLDVQVLDRVSDELRPAANTVYHLALHDDMILAARDAKLLLAAVEKVKGYLRLGALELAEGKSTFLADPADPQLDPDVAASPLLKAPAVLCAGLPLHIPNALGIAAAKILLRGKWKDALAKLEVAEKMKDPQDIVRTLAIAGPWTRIEFLVSTLHAAQLGRRGPHRFGDEVSEMVEEADALTQRLLHVALGADAHLAGPVAIMVAHLPFREGGLGAPCAAVEMRKVACLAEVYRERDEAVPDTDKIAEWEVKRATGRQRDYHAMRLFLDRILPKNLRVQLAHHAVRGVGAMWRDDVSDFSCTLMSPRVASKALALWLLCPPMAAITVCGDTLERIPHAIGPDGERAHHLYVCKCNATARHNATYRAMGNVISAHAGPGYRVQFECVADQCGAPLPRTGEHGEKAPGDLVISGGPPGNAHMFVDVGISTTAAGVDADDAVLRGNGAASKAPLLASVTKMNKDKLRSGLELVPRPSKFVPCCFSGFGAGDHITKASTTAMAAFVSVGSLPLPLKAPTLASKIRAAATAALHAATARFAVKIEESNPEYDREEAVAEAEEHEPFSAPEAVKKFRVKMAAASQHILGAGRGAVDAFLRTIRLSLPPRGRPPRSSNQRGSSSDSRSSAPSSGPSTPRSRQSPPARTPPAHREGRSPKTIAKREPSSGLPPRRPDRLPPDRGPPDPGPHAPPRPTAAGHPPSTGFVSGQPPARTALHGSMISSSWNSVAGSAPGPALVLDFLPAPSSGRLVASSDMPGADAVPWPAYGQHPWPVWLAGPAVPPAWPLPAAPPWPLPAAPPWPPHAMPAPPPRVPASADADTGHRQPDAVGLSTTASAAVGDQVGGGDASAGC